MSRTIFVLHGNDGREFVVHSAHTDEDMAHEALRSRWAIERKQGIGIAWTHLSATELYGTDHDALRRAAKRLLEEVENCSLPLLRISRYTPGPAFRDLRARSEELRGVLDCTTPSDPAPTNTRGDTDV